MLNRVVVTIDGVNYTVVAEEDEEYVRKTAALVDKTLCEIKAQTTFPTVTAAVLTALNIADKPQLLLMYSQDLVASGWNAGADLRAAAQFIQGGGGGQPGLAMAGGRNVAGLPEALEAMLAKTK